MSNNIAGKVVVITGASSGLGETTARHLAAQGAHLVLGARRLDKLEALANDIRAAGGQVEVAATDVTRQQDVNALVAAAVTRFGRVDVMINNAGLMAVAPMTALNVGEWDSMIDINVKGLLYGVAAALPVFQKQDSGHFINIASVAGLKVFGNATVYSATKFAVRTIAEGLRTELGANIRSTIISPGAVDSELKFGSSHTQSAAAVLDFYQMAIPSESVARAIAYAIEQPANVDINEIVLRPTAQEF
jgi:NADP-dependent 3-hydroxy acid dehydrogenase YdfG